VADSLPAVPDETAVAEAPIDGEIVEETPAAVRPVVNVVQVITVVVQHPVPRTAARHAGHIAAGAVVLWRRRRQGRTLAQRMARQAEMAGDHANALLWHQKEADERHRRHERRLAVAELVISLARASPWIAACTLGAMAALGVLLAIATHSMAMAAWPFTTAARITADAVAVASVTWLAAVALGAAGFILLLHETGRRAGDLAPGWSAAAKTAAEDRGLVVTADTIVLALDNLPVTALKQARKSGWKPAFTTMPVRDGRGYSAVFSLPLGVTPEMIADQRPVLARNLHREEIEVWPSAGPPGFASLWVADRGAIAKAAPEYPLLHEGQADVFEGVPGGVIARGDDVLIPIVGNNGVLGGMMGQGKSNAGRVIFLGACLDPLAELDVFVFANNGDFDAYAPRLARYVKGTEDDAAAAAVDRLHELYEEVGRREGRLAELGAKKVTRGLAEAHPDMRPVVALFSECHELFGHPEYGDLAADLATKTIKRARKTAITLWFDTQSSRKEAIPPRLVELVSVNCCFAVKTWRSNDGFLGDGSFAAGIRATELRPGRDRGTSLVTGVSDAQFELVKWYFIPVDDDTGYDAAAEVIARAMGNLAPGTSVAGNSPLRAIEVRDLLTDLAAVTEGPDRVRLADLPARLRKLAPSWLPYRGLDGVQLAPLLDREGVPWVKPKNVPQLDPAELDRVIARREDEVS
jgi:DNA segregation ATPase FtsK/SpoIIIE, S-DNA-T family